MADIHCFECSAVVDAAAELADTMQHLPPFRTETLAFLPAPRTWLEWRSRKGNNHQQVGVLLEERTNDTATALLSIKTDRYFGAASGHIRLPLHGHHDFGRRIAFGESFEGVKEWVQDHAALLYALLAMINSPRIIGRRQHMPHRAFERDLLRALKPVGKFPLHAWTEIKLEVNAPRDVSGEPSTEAHLTGRRALHFCRAHLRVRLGRLEVVKAHWRGDGSLGIKQQRYRLTWPRVAMLAWLVVGTAAYGGAVQGVQAIRYPSLAACRAALAQLVLRERADAVVTVAPHCTERKPAWWSDLAGPPA